MDELYLPIATIKRFDSTRTSRLYQATTDASEHFLFKDGNYAAFHDNLDGVELSVRRGPAEEDSLPEGSCMRKFGSSPIRFEAPTDSLRDRDSSI